MFSYLIWYFVLPFYLVVCSIGIKTSCGIFRGLFHVPSRSPPYLCPTLYEDLWNKGIFVGCPILNDCLSSYPLFRFFAEVESRLASKQQCGLCRLVLPFPLASPSFSLDPTLAQSWLWVDRNFARRALKKRVPRSLFVIFPELNLRANKSRRRRDTEWHRLEQNFAHNEMKRPLH